MKVVIINQHVSDVLGGSEMQCDIIASGLAKAGHEVTYVAVNTRDSRDYSNLNYNYKIIYFDIRRHETLTQILKEVQPDIIYWRYNKFHLLSCVMQAGMLNIPFVFAVSHIADVTKYAYIRKFPSKGLSNKIKSIKRKARKKLASRINYRAFSFIDGLTSLNSQYLNKVPVKIQKTIWNSIPSGEEPFSWNKPYVIWVSNIKAAKRPELYIKLATLLSERCPGVDFLMIGKIQDTNYHEVFKQAEKLKNFHFLGPKSPELVNGSLKNALALVQTCAPEGFGNIFIQAWMQGCPTVSFEYDPDNLITSQNLGFISGSMEKMAEDVETIIKNKVLRNEIGSRAKLFAQQNFSPERMVKEVETFLQKVIDSPARSKPGFNFIDRQMLKVLSSL